MADSFMLKAILSAVDKISPTLKTVRGGINATHKSFRDLGSASRGLVGSMGLPTAISFAAIGYGALNAAKSALDYAGALQDTVDKTGMALQPLQELQTVFEAGGVAGEEFNESVIKLNKGLAEAAAGKDDGLASLLTKLRIPLRDATGHIRSVEELLPQLADAFEKNENPALRTRMAMELFGKSGAKMIAILMKGGNSLEEARRQAQRLGATLSDEATGRLDDLGDSFGFLGKQVRVQIAEAFGFAAPAVQAATEALSQWIGANKDMLQLKVGNFIKTVATSVQGWVESGGLERLSAAFMRVVEGIGEFVDAMGGMRNVLIGIGALILAGPVSSAVQLVMVFARMATYIVPLLLSVLPMVATAFLAVGRAMLANPILAVIAAIATAAFLIYDNWGAVSAWFIGLWDGVKATFAAFIGFVTNAFMSFHPLGIIIRNWEPIVAWFSSLWDRVKGFIEPIMSGARAIGGAIGSVFSGGASAPVAQGASALARQPTSPTQAGPTGSPLVARGALAGPQQPARLNGELNIRFEGAPEGMRVDPGRTNQPGVAVNPHVGYRSALSF